MTKFTSQERTRTSKWPNSRGQNTNLQKVLTNNYNLSQIKLNENLSANQKRRVDRKEQHTTVQIIKKKKKV